MGGVPPQLGRGEEGVVLSRGEESRSRAGSRWEGVLSRGGAGKGAHRACSATLQCSAAALVTQLGGLPALSSQAGLPSGLWVVGRQEAVVPDPLRKPGRCRRGQAQPDPRGGTKLRPITASGRGAPVPPRQKGPHWPWGGRGPGRGLGVSWASAWGCGTHPDLLTCRLSLHTREVSLHCKVTPICGVCPPAPRSAPHLMNPQPSPAE